MVTNLDAHNKWNLFHGLRKITPLFTVFPSFIPSSQSQLITKITNDETFEIFLHPYIFNTGYIFDSFHIFFSLIYRDGVEGISPNMRRWLQENQINLIRRK